MQENNQENPQQPSSQSSASDEPGMEPQLTENEASTVSPDQEATETLPPVPRMEPQLAENAASNVSPDQETTETLPPVPEPVKVTPEPVVTAPVPPAKVPTPNFVAPKPVASAAMPPRVAPAKKSRWKLWTILAAVILILVGGGTAFAVYHHEYRHVALPGTQIAQESVAGMNEKQLTSFIDKKVSQTRLNLKGASSPTVTAQELGMSVDASAMAKSVLRENNEIFPYVRALFTHRDVPIKPRVNYVKLYKKVLELNTSEHSKLPEEPKIAPDANAGKFVIVEGKPGYGISPYWLTKQMQKALNRAKQQSVKVKSETVPTLHKGKELQALLKDANEFVSVNAEIKGNQKVHQASAVDKMSFLKIPSVLEKLPPKMPVDTAVISQWVQQQCDSEHIDPVNGYRYLNSRKEVVAMRTNPVDGKQVNNTQQLQKALAESFSQKKDFSDAMAISTLPAKWEEKVIADGAEKLPYMAAEGEKWIDVNLNPAVRTVTAYVGATPVAGPFPHVPGVPRMPTVTGQFAVKIKYKVQTMRGSSIDGVPYVVPNVPWILYFHGDYALHGAPWRSTFGPGAEGGSHGCVNLPVPVAKTLYDFAPLGTVVMVHN